MGGEGSLLVALATACVASLALGFLTAYGQEWLPAELGSLANSAGSWSLIAFALALLGSSLRIAGALGALVLIGLLFGYVVGAHVRGFAAGTALVLFWSAAAVTAGPALGLGAHWVKTRRDHLAAVGTGVMSGVLVGEGVYGLSFISDTTYPPYWWGEIAAGVTLLVVIGVRVLRQGPTAAIAAAACCITATAFVVIYHLDLISVLP
jgi:hypothetical protein